MHYVYRQIIQKVCIQSISISFAFTFNLYKLLPTSPNICFTQNKHYEEINFNINDKQLFVNEDEDEVMLTCSKGRKNVSELALQRYISYYSMLYTK